jgi:hypothetical protein
MPFIVGQYYKRELIQAELDGEIQSYLPQRGGRVVAGCFGRKMRGMCHIEIGDPMEVDHGSNL